MTLEQYLSTISGSVSDVKRKILTELWHGEEAFPKPWVPSSHLLQITNQKYFDRRTRELRDQQGCDIETKRIDGEHQYRLVSNNLAASNPRHYLTEPQKRQLFEAANSRCQVCGVEVDAGVRGLQADHKKPLIRGGSHNLDNWQAVCNECNVAKRRACQDCADDCLTCQWAFPEDTGFPLIARVSKELFDSVQIKQRSNPDWLSELIASAFDARDK